MDIYDCYANSRYVKPITILLRTRERYSGRALMSMPTNTIYDLTNAASMVDHGKRIIASTSGAWRLSRRDRTCESAESQVRSCTDGTVGARVDLFGLNWSTRSSKSLLWPCTRRSVRDRLIGQDTYIELLEKGIIHKCEEHVFLKLFILLHPRIRRYRARGE